MEVQSSALTNWPGLQVLDNDRHAHGARSETSAGERYALYGRAGTLVRPVGEYNAGRLVVQDGRVKHEWTGTKSSNTT